MTDRTKTICPPIFDLGGIKNIIIVEAFLHIIASTCMSSLDALMFYKGAQNDFSRKLYA